MSTRSNFDQNLKELKEQILNMAEEAKKAVTKSMLALKNQDFIIAEKIIDNDIKLNKMEEIINEKAIFLIATEAPVAVDLRKIITAIKISSEIERIADMAVNIAKSTLHIGHEQLMIPIEKVETMMGIALKMFSDSMIAYYGEDEEFARQCAKKDDAVDEMYGELITEMIVNTPTHPKARKQITQLGFICRYIERIADHVTNISENVVYLATGRQSGLNV
ncbi:phosphate signaling complex protein PhoU [Bacillus aquiflavi]|uniref:Phosphate-specific transport system accessory protein PhoU n=1 Tax=Bacillus aquiflavi TaxID=2672567 RepID=A0A6B3VTA8_9BACI|nr:phosphate signaling complex protein PhoU [Bacillus aquiflavi]MBA4535827.1 phosphate signaling complex protein PhoU [Bacillus aquiflavi]NEY80202.1 phosphate signaling complex protein PhoU [Bacillus aquiflavi]UAC47254.1 phosphate signaling complex protein PhoU [Bacillus aquiflavi]